MKRLLQVLIVITLTLAIASNASAYTYTEDGRATWATPHSWPQNLIGKGEWQIGKRKCVSDGYSAQYKGTVSDCKITIESMRLTKKGIPKAAGASCRNTSKIFKACTTRVGASKKRHIYIWKRSYDNPPVKMYKCGFHLAHNEDFDDWAYFSSTVDGCYSKSVSRFTRDKSMCDTVTMSPTAYRCFSNGLIFILVPPGFSDICTTCVIGHWATYGFYLPDTVRKNTYSVTSDKA